jgi:hypothetical protein
MKPIIDEDFILKLIELTVCDEIVWAKSVYPGCVYTIIRGNFHESSPHRIKFKQGWILYELNFSSEEHYTEYRWTLSPLSILGKSIKDNMQRASARREERKQKQLQEDKNKIMALRCKDK